ncbi:hypothetical protein HMI55_001989 [Coelomomyces lativittatus]|nr:hypothetical protein HMI55_001989 [Coelomomyces lativittatus]
MKTIDVGNPQLSMHSIREQAGVHDIEHAIRLFTGCFELHDEMESTLQPVD